MIKGAKRVGKKDKINKIIYLLGVFCVIVLNIMAWMSVEFCDWYVQYIHPVWLNTYARLTSSVPFSIGEIMLIMAVIITCIGIGWGILNVIKKNKYKKALCVFARFYAWVFLIVCYIMTCNCFILYHASGFEDKYMVKESDQTLVAAVSDDIVVHTLNLKKNNSDITSNYSKKELAILRDYLVEKCNMLALEIERDDSGAAVYNGNLIAEATKAMKNLGEKYDQLSGFYVTPKYLSCSEFFSQQYIMGYYFPFSLEANINSVMYITNVAPTVCHELSHTKGFMNEDDANFIGFLACIESEDTFLEYCGYLSVLNYVNNDFYQSINKNKNKYKKHVRISDLVADDNVFLTREDWQVVEKKAVVKTATVKKVSNTIMETTLKLNGIEQGMQQYDEVVDLLLKYYDGELY